MKFFGRKKKNSVVNATEYSPYYSDSSSYQKEQESHLSSLAGFEKKDAVYKTRIRLLRFATRCVSLILSAFMVGTMSYALISYFNTKHHTFEGVQVWGAPKVLWPTYLVLSMAGLTFVMNFITISTYLLSIRAANKSGDFTVFTGYVLLGIEIVVWAVSSALYKVADTGTDLWGYSCGKQTQNFADKVKSFVNFGKLCQAQNATWFVCVIQTAFHILTLITLILVFRRLFGKKKIDRIRSSQIFVTEQGQNEDRERVYKPGMGKQYLPLMSSPRSA